MESHTLSNGQGRRFKSGRSWLTAAENTITAVCDMNDISPGQDQTLVHDQPLLTQVAVQPGRGCWDCVYSATELQVQEITQSHCGSSDMVLYTDGSAITGRKSGWFCRLLQQGGCGKQIDQLLQSLHPVCGNRVAARSGRVSQCCDGLTEHVKEERTVKPVEAFT